MLLRTMDLDSQSEGTPEKRRSRLIRRSIRIQELANLRILGQFVVAAMVRQAWRLGTIRGDRPQSNSGRLWRFFILPDLQRIGINTSEGILSRFEVPVYRPCAGIRLWPCAITPRISST